MEVKKMIEQNYDQYLALQVDAYYDYDEEEEIDLTEKVYEDWKAKYKAEKIEKVEKEKSIEI
jgi:hypothetical protein